MRSDLITALTTPLSPRLRAMGYLREALDMRRRARGNRTAWQPHLERTRRFVLSSAERCANRDRAVILGSGLLLDVPLDELAGLFREVFLKDVVCLPEVRKQLRAHGNVRFVEHDVTGLAEPLSQNKQQGIHRLPELAPLPAGEDDDADLVVSLNILSQLWVVPRAFIGRQMRRIDPSQVDEWCGRIVEAHYAWLRSRSCDVCLIADHASITRDGAGGIISRASTIYGLSLPGPDASWTWNIAPRGKGSRQSSRELLVGAWHMRR